MPRPTAPPDERRSRQATITRFGFYGEEELPVEVIADDTEPGEVRLELVPRPLDFQKPEDRREPTTAYLTPTDAAILGHQLIESSRRATMPPKEG